MNQVRYVILVVVDGMTPQAMQQARTPAMHGLIQRGASTLFAQTVMPSITLPTHMSMFHGVPPEIHSVLGNTWHPMPDEPVLGIVDLVRREKRRAAAFYTWEELRDLWRPGSLVYSSYVNIYGPDGEKSDRLIAELAAEYITREPPDFTFLYLGQVDETGHRFGWHSPEYIAAVEGADAALAHVLERLEGARLLEHTACLLTADHGGHDHGHGSADPADITVPWVLAGPGVRQGHVLTSPVRIYDTAPTIAHLLDLPLPQSWQGRPIIEAIG